MSKVNKKKQKQINIEGLEPININVAGIDIGSRELWVAVPADRDKKPIRTFGNFTPNLKSLGKWLKKCGIDLLVMESTGTYWVPVYNILEQFGFTIHLVNARDAKSCPGRRKTDNLDCKWLQKLGTYGMLSPSFIPENQVRNLQAFMGQRESLTKNSSSFVQRIQKILTGMNLFLHNVISDITGKSGIAILEAIIEGETNPAELAKLCNHRIRANRDKVIQSLTGNYSRESIFLIKQNLEMYKSCQNQILACEEKCIELLRQFESKLKPPEKKTEKPKSVKNLIHQIVGVDLTAIPGMKALSVQKVLAKTGMDFSYWPSEKHFTSWLGLAPNREISGGKEGKVKRKKMTNPATQAFKMAAHTLYRGDCYLGAFYRKMKSRFGPSKAKSITARKLAEIFYRMVVRGEEFKEYGKNKFEEAYQKRKLDYLKRSAKKLGFEIVPTP